MRYVHEPEPGIAAARNRALDEAGPADLLVFIDDDERPVDGWLARLVETYRVDRPTAVVGPVVSEYEQQPDAWVSAGRFFDRRRLADRAPRRPSRRPTTCSSTWRRCARSACGSTSGSG